MTLQLTVEPRITRTVSLFSRISPPLFTRLRWLNTVLRAVSGNSRDGVCFKLDKQTWRRKKQWYTEDNSQNIIIKIFIWRILNNENFKMEVEKTNFVTHLIITEQ